MQYSNNDTIAAIATPTGIGALLIIRVSGEDAITVTNKIFSGRKKLTQAKSHTIHYGNICDTNGDVIDDVLVSVFCAPYSFTGENSCEISTHGNPFIAQKILQLFLEYEVRLAEPGEFTKRAFLNGRLDLAQAEAVVDVIEASTEASLRGARNQLDGILSTKVASLRDMLIETSSLIELELDFVEEELEFIDNTKLLEGINQLLDEIKLLLNTYSFGKIVRDGVNVALVGKPNVGKSSLLNYILKESRSIVSHIPGTTRDIIREEVAIEGILFRLFDTAGIRKTEDEIEKEGVLRSRNAVKNADITFFINDVTQGYDLEMEQELLTLTSKERIVTIFNKIDLKESPALKADVKISAKTGEGMPELFEILKQKSIGTQSYSEKNAIVSNIRHYNGLKKAKECLLLAKESLGKGMSSEFIASDLRSAELALGEIIGVVTSDDILNNIFSRFCIGK